MITRILSRAAFVCFALVLTTGADAQPTTVWKGGTGDWNTSANWTVGVPSTGTNAQIDHNVLNSVVSLSSNGSVKNLTVDAGDQLDLAGHDLTLTGSSLTAGQLKFMSAGGANISGSGTITATNDISVSGVPMIVGSGVTVNLNAGGPNGPYGQIHSQTISNNGTVVSDESNQAFVATTAIQNAGTLSSNGGVLILQTAVINNDGLIEAASNGSVIDLGFAGGVSVTGSGS